MVTPEIMWSIMKIYQKEAGFYCCVVQKPVKVRHSRETLTFICLQF